MIQSDPSDAIATLGAGLGLGALFLSFLAFVALGLFVLLGIVWLFVPFAIFGLKKRLDRIAGELEALRLTLVPAVQRPRKESHGPANETS